jgi:glycyl-tRNA synthetase
MPKPLDFQSMIFSLQKFWADQGCLIWQPYYTQVGAGTNNPATFLRVLGPEPWKVAYVEPSIRPDDGRYGENPNRMQQHYQFQVILKPDPGNPQELYLQSLQAIGIDPHQHDIRFVEDNWESPALGAWGLGWEVWCDGQEITQFTYFQQSGGLQLDPVSVEITYGLDRIAIALQKVQSFREIHWNERITSGDVNLQGEQEHSKYYFEVADVERTRQMYNLFEAEAESALKEGLVLPAYDYLLKCSHTFNILDTRGAVGVTERQVLFGRMRELSRRISEGYLESRRHLEYPWLDETSRTSVSVPVKIAAPVSQTERLPFLFEIGCEELPAADLASALEQLKGRLPTWLDDLRLAHGLVQVLGTPRRLTVYVEDLATSQPDRETLVKGPPANRAFDALGQPTPAAAGFAKSRGLQVSDLKVMDIDGGQYAAARVFEKGRPAVEVLAEALLGLVSGIKFDKSMRWNASNVAFSRPLRWFMALLGGAVVPFTYAGYSSSNTTRGLRFRIPEEQPIHNPAEYFNFLRSQGILLDPVERRQSIADQTARLMQAEGGAVNLPEALLDEVSSLVEAPTALVGRFAKDQLRLPPEVLVSVMKKHQRYFPVQDAAGKLLPCFIIVRNGDGQHLEVVADGNEQVIRARFADAAFFIDEDMKRPLPEFLPRLGTLTFQKRLGSMLDKSKRVTALVEKLTPILGLTADEAKTAHRAAELCKADLVTHMVVEMTSLQGLMGRYYALHAGETPAVANAIYEHYLPRFGGDELPSAKAGLAVSIADRLDTLAGLFAAGLAPSGTKDPFAQRRAALGLVQALMGWNLPFDLRRGLQLAAEGLPIPADPVALNACFDFIVGRMRSLLVEQEGYRYDVVDAVLAAQSHNPAGVLTAVKELTAWVARPDWSTILPAYGRCVRITRDQKERFSANPAAFVEPVETDLYAAVQAVAAAPRSAGSVEGFFTAFLPAIPVINRFFDLVMVMVDDPVVRANRLGLLQSLAALPADVADFSLLEGF